ncbi:MAG: ABC transporter substrate-binding protein [Usitatibacteraceae bacterium]
MILRPALLLIALLCACCAAPPASATKTLHVVKQTISMGPLDPAQVNSLHAAHVIDNLFEPMLEYHYLARPLKLQPLTLREMPEVQEAGRVYICHLKPGIFFADDAAFKGKPRELVAADYAYSFRRLFDPRYRSSQFFMVDGKIAGADALRKAAFAAKRFDYETPIRGLTVLDRYTLRIELTEPDLNFLHVLAQQNLAAVAREVVEAYGDDVHQHPVGTGAFQLREWQPGHRMVLERNPRYREADYHHEDGVEPDTLEVSRALDGKRLPMVDRVELGFTVESQPMWLTFLRGEYDYLINVPVEFRLAAVPNGTLAPYLQQQGVQLRNYAYPSIWFAAFNMKDPVVGGYTAERVALRRAIALAFDAEAAVNIAMSGGAIIANGVVPPGVTGYDARFRTDALLENLPRAKALLDVFGYVDRDGDGFREDPQGKPLSIEMMSFPEPRFVVWDELYARTLKKLRIRHRVAKVHQSEAIRMRQAAKYQVSQDAWNMDFPDGEDFYIILSGPAAGTANTSHFALPAFDSLFEQSRLLQDGPARNAIYREMDRLMLAYMPIIPHVFLLRSAVAQPWLRNYVPHTVHIEPWKYLDVDETRQSVKTP